MKGNMHILNDVQKRVQDFVSENSTTLLTAGGVVGTVATGVLAGRAGFKAAQIIAEEERAATMERAAEEMEAGENPHFKDPVQVELSKTDKVKLSAIHFVPPIITGGATIASIVLNHRMTAQKAAALAAAYGLSQRQFEEYKEKVAEKLTGPKKQQITDELAQERVNRAPGSNQIIIFGDEVICFDQPTGRFFKSTMEKINKAANATNSEIIHHGSVSASYFYSELELEPTTWSDEVGWNTPFELEITTTMTPDEKPCLAIDFKRLPSADYMGPNY